MKNDVQRIYLLRHGAIATPKPKVFVGQQDYHLTDEGQQQMQNIFDWLQSKKITQVFCSPLTRCQEGAKIIGGKKENSVQVVNDLKEISLGQWEGLNANEIQTRFPGEYEKRGKNFTGYRPPGGESFNDLQQRVWNAFTTLLTVSSKDIAILAHAGTNRVIIAKILGMPLPRIFALQQDFGAVNVLTRKQWAFSVELLNFIP